MGSLTKKTNIIRARKAAKAGRANKKARTKAATPKFPVHLEKVAASGPA